VLSSIKKIIQTIHNLGYLIDNGNINFDILLEEWIIILI